MFIRSRGVSGWAIEVNLYLLYFFFKSSFPLASHDRRTAAYFMGDGSFVGLRSVDGTDAVYCLSAFHADLRMGIRKPMRRYGEQEQQARREQSRLVTETMKGYAELELNAAFPFLQQVLRPER